VRFLNKILAPEITKAVVWVLNFFAPKYRQKMHTYNVAEIDTWFLMNLPHYIQSHLVFGLFETTSYILS
jgi:hypothetical protein